jgi:hypothetical protein
MALYGLRGAFLSEQTASLSLKRERRAQINRTWPANEGHGGADDGGIATTPHALINTGGAALAPRPSLPSSFTSWSFLSSFLIQLYDTH